MVWYGTVRDGTVWYGTVRATKGSEFLNFLHYKLTFNLFYIYPVYCYFYLHKLMGEHKRKHMNEQQMPDRHLKRICFISQNVLSV
jgi:hypothetical protein